MLKKSLKTKLVTILLLISAIPLLISSTLLYRQATEGLDGMIDENIQHAKTVSDYYFEQKANEALLIAKRYANDEEVISIFKQKNREKLNQKMVPIYNMLEEEKGLSIFEFGDEKGQVVTRAHNLTKFSDDKSDSKDIAAALSGEEVKGFSFGQSGLAVRAFVPVKDGNKVIGTFQVGFGFTDNMLNDIRHSIAGNISLYENDKLALTTEKEHLNEMGQPIRDVSISDKVLAGQEVKVIEGEQIHFYHPLYNPLGDKVQGMIQISQDLTPIMKMEKNLFVKTIIIILGTIVIAIVVSFYLANSITRPISNVVKRLQAVAQGDLSAEKMVTSSQDEVGELVHAINQTSDHLRYTIQNVSHAAGEVSSRSEELTQSSNEVKEGSMQVAVTMEELARGADTQANIAHDLDQVMEDFIIKMEQANEAGEQVAHASNEVLEMTSKGRHFMESSIQQMSSIHSLVKESVEKVQGFDKQSQEVSKLVDVIQSIAQQTNLLALNAEIEAARAGEHGKGFAVVADEVRKLAEQVSESVTDITTIVGNIQNEAKGMVHSLETGYRQVEEGSSQIKVTGETFKQINEAVTTTVEKIGRVSRRLASMSENSKGMNASIETIVSVSEQAAAGAEQTSASVQQTATSVEEIAESAHSLSLLAEQLYHQVSKFKL
ncbi:methyl-accepting chemotaxis protein [Bacillus sp. FJAT-42315]|uniref:methyl-accepting chemotaxis protein n=1 Tax=Bacillus sp. FJAT-42315 TaxID=2014077 RepID=UPI000C249CD2|nr:methyl-accepting chemotaxis protein [Bacillus sp. FJAT-42315]